MTNLGASIGTALAGSILIATLSAAFTTNIQNSDCNSVQGEVASADAAREAASRFISGRRPESRARRGTRAAEAVRRCGLGLREARDLRAPVGTRVLATSVVIALFLAQKIPTKQPGAKPTTALSEGLCTHASGLCRALPCTRASHAGESAMCRWLAYYGKPVRMDKVLFGPQHSLIEQSLSSRMGAEPTNGDGFGIGWYSASGEPGIFKSMEPAWNDRNLRELAGHVESHLFLAHVRATTGTPVQQTNCHPLPLRQVALGAQRADRRLAHRQARPRARGRSGAVPADRGNDRLGGALLPRRDARLEDDPPGAVERAIGLVEDVGRRHGVKYPFQGTIATTDGERLWAFRYASDGKARSLYFSTSYETLKMLYPTIRVSTTFDEETRVVGLRAPRRPRRRLEPRPRGELGRRAAGAGRV
jgi:glutamine amidotransferase